MKKLFLTLLLLTGVIAVNGQTTTADLGRCLADSTTGKDRKDLVKWILIALVQNPAMADTLTVAPTKIEDVNKAAALVFQRLMTVDCKIELKAAYKDGQDKAIETAFGKLGEVAVGEVLTDGQLDKAVAGLTKHMDLQKLRKLLEDK